MCGASPRHMLGLADFIATHCARAAAEEPRFWTVAPDEHIEQLSFHVLIAACAVAADRFCWPPLRAAGAAAPAARDRYLGVALLLWIPVNVLNKWLLQSFSIERVALEIGLLPCHVYSALAAFALLSGGAARHGTLRSLLLYASWMPLMALAFPDLASARTVAATHPGRANLIVCLFFAHHLLLLATPVYLLRTAVATRRGGGRDERLPPGRAFVRYVAFSYSYIGVGLCVAALATCRNLNYSLWPPKLPATIVAQLGGARYRVTIGVALAFVVGPAMAHVVLPLLSKIVGAVAAAARAKQGAKEHNQKEKRG